MKALLLIAALLWAYAAEAGEVRDPMRPPQARAHHARHIARAPLPQLSAIFIRTDASGERIKMSKAIVNGRWVRSGDTIGGGRIHSISSSGVRWVRRGKAHQLRLPGSSSRFKMPATDPPRAGNGVPNDAP